MEGGFVAIPDSYNIMYYPTVIPAEAKGLLKFIRYPDAFSEINTHDVVDVVAVLMPRLQLEGKLAVFSITGLGTNNRIVPPMGISF